MLPLPPPVSLLLSSRNSQNSPLSSHSISLFSHPLLSLSLHLFSSPLPSPLIWSAMVSSLFLSSTLSSPPWEQNSMFLWKPEWELQFSVACQCLLSCPDSVSLVLLIMCCCRFLACIDRNGNCGQWFVLAPFHSLSVTIPFFLCTSSAEWLSMIQKINGRQSKYFVLNYIYAPRFQALSIMLDFSPINHTHPLFKEVLAANELFFFAKYKLAML